MTVETPQSPPPVFGLDRLLPEPANPCVCLDLLVIQNLFETLDHYLTDAQRQALTDMAVRLCAQLGVPFEPAMIKSDRD